MKSWLTLFILFVLVSTLGYTQVTNKLDNLQVGTLTTKTIDVTSTVKASKPCPKMTLAERDAVVSPLEGQCVYNSTAKTLNLFDGSSWVEVAGGGEGGIANWQATKFYDVDDVVIYLDNIYQCNTQHTSSASFDPSKFDILAQDLASTTGVLDAAKIGAGVVDNTEFSYLNNATSEIQTQLNGKEPTITTLPLSKGGTNKNATALAGSVVYSDADSFELTGQGIAGQVLQSNGTAAPTWEQIVVNSDNIIGPVTLEKGGTGNNITAEDKAIVYSDADSFELLSPGTEGQVLKMGALAPEWGNAGVSVSNNYATATELSKLTVPNEVLTEQAAGEYYLEKNNNNILRDPSFEGASYASIWSVNVTSDKFGTNAIDGGFMLRALPSNQTVEILQDSQTYAEAFADGSVQGMASARIKTSVAGVKLCPRKAAVTQTSLCVTHTGSGKWEHLKVPFILGDVSNGLVILTSSNVTGTIYVDDTFVGAVDPKVDGQAINSQSSELNRVATFGATNITGALTLSRGQGLYSYNSSTGFYTALKKISVSASIALKQNGATRVLAAISKSGSGVVSLADGDASIGDGWSEASYSGELLPGEQISFSNATGTTTEHKISLSAIEIASTSTYSSTNADTDWQDCTFASSSWSGLGTVNFSNLKCKRQGGDLKIYGKVVTGTVSAASLQIPIPTWNGVQLTSKSTVPSSTMAGRITRNNGIANNSKDYSLIIGPSISYMNMSYNEFSQAVNPLIAASASSILGNNETIVFEHVTVPIEGWEQSNILIGQFNGLESCKDSYECESTFSARINGSGQVSEENLDFIQGQCSVNGTTGEINCPFKTGVFTSPVGPNCQVTPIMSQAVNGVMATISSLTSSGVIFKSNRHDAAIVIDSVLLMCQKQGADYVSKTAKAVASDQNVRSIGAVGVDIQSVYFGSGSSCLNPCNVIGSCTVCTRVGSKITSVEAINTTGFYRLNGIDGTKYICNGQGLGGSSSGVITHELGSSASTYAGVQAWNAGSGAAQGRASVTCIGVP